MEREISLPDGFRFEFFVRRTRIEGEAALVGSVFDRGETVFAKVYNEEGVLQKKQG